MGKVGLDSEMDLDVVEDEDWRWRRGGRHGIRCVAATDDL